MKGKIVLVPFPFTDLTAAKLRPALVIYEGKRDMVISFISSKIPYESSDVDIVLRRGQNSFKKSGLKLDSVIKLDKIATVLKDLVVGELGELDGERKAEVNQKLRKIFEI